MDISKLPVIPQYLNTCWFNAILMSLLYSDGCQETLYNIAIRNKWNLNLKGESFKFLLYKILDLLVRIKNEKNIEILRGLYENLEELYRKNKPEKIFLKYTYKYDYSIRQRFDIGYYKEFIISFLKNLEIPVLDIIIKDGKTYIGFITFYKEYMMQPITVIKQIKELIMSGVYFIIKMDKFSEYLYIPESFNIIYFQGIIINPEFTSITIKHNEYTLKSSILDNYDETAHTICGIFYNNLKYVYNGWLQTTKKPCNLILFDWFQNEDFKINTRNCTLISPTSSDKLRFNFKKGTKVNIYTTSPNTSLLPDIKSFRELSHITSHVVNYYDILLQQGNEDDVINEILKFIEYIDLETFKSLTNEGLISLTSRRTKSLYIKRLKNFEKLNKEELELLSIKRLEELNIEKLEELNKERSILLNIQAFNLLNKERLNEINIERLKLLQELNIEKLELLNKIEFKLLIIERLKLLDIEIIRKILNKILIIHYDLENEEAKIIYTLQSALIEADNIKQEAIENVKKIQEDKYMELEKDNIKKATNIILEATEKSNRIIIEALEQAEKIKRDAYTIEQQILNRATINTIREAQPKSTFFSRNRVVPVK